MPSLIQKHAHVKGQRSNHHILKFQPNPSWAKKRPNRYTSFENKYVTIILKPHAYLQTIYKTLAKFQEDRNKTVEGISLTKYPLMHLLQLNTRSSQVEKSRKMTIMSKPHSHLTMNKMHTKFHEYRNKIYEELHPQNPLIANVMAKSDEVHKLRKVRDFFST